MFIEQMEEEEKEASIKWIPEKRSPGVTISFNRRRQETGIDKKRNAKNAMPNPRAKCNLLLSVFSGARVFVCLIYPCVCVCECTVSLLFSTCLRVELSDEGDALLSGIVPTSRQLLVHFPTRQ